MAGGGHALGGLDVDVAAVAEGLQRPLLPRQPCHHAGLDGRVVHHREGPLEHGPHQRLQGVGRGPQAELQVQHCTLDQGVRLRLRLLPGGQGRAGKVLELHAPARPAPRVGPEEVEGAPQSLVRVDAVEGGDVLLARHEGQLLPELQHPAHRRAQLPGQQPGDGVLLEVGGLDPLSAQPPGELLGAVGVVEPGELTGLLHLLRLVVLGGGHRRLSHLHVHLDAAIVDPLIGVPQLTFGLRRPSWERLGHFPEHDNVLPAVLLEVVPLLGLVRGEGALSLAVGLAEQVDEPGACGVLLLPAEGPGQILQALRVAVLPRESLSVLPGLRVKVLPVVRVEAEMATEADALEGRVVGPGASARDLGQLGDLGDALGVRGDLYSLLPIPRVGAHQDAEVRVRHVCIHVGLLEIDRGVGLDVDEEVGLSHGTGSF